MLAVSQFRLRRTRRVVPVVLGAMALILGAAPAAGAATALAPPIDGIGCLGGPGLAGCTTAPSLNGAAAVALSPDGRNAYAAARDAGAVTVLGRDTAGRLSLISCLAAGTPGCATARAVTGATAVDVSRDGRLVAVASPSANGVAVFLRDTTTGLLTQPAGAAGCATETGDGGTCLDGRALSGARDVAFSADGTRLYVAAQTANAVAVLATDAVAGITSQPAGAAGCVSETGTSGLCGDGWSLFAPSSVAALPAGGVLVATSTSGSLVRLNLNAGTGALSQPSGATGCIRDTGTGSCPDGRALAGASDVTITPDGSAALVTAGTSDAVARIGLGGTLTQAGGAAGCVSETGLSGQCLDGRALDGAASVSVSPDGRTAYAAATSSDAVAVLDLSTAGFSQGTDGTGCVSDRGGSSCAARAGLDGARGVAVDSAGRPVTAAETSDTVLAHRLNRAPSCTAAGAEATWERAVTLTPVCSDPDGDPLTLRLTSVPKDSAVALAGGSVTVNPRHGEATTLSIGVAASDGTLSSPAVTLTVKITAPPPIPPKPVPSLPATLSAPLLGIERRPLDLARPSTTLPTFCLPRRAASCSGTVELRAGSRALGATPATGPGQVTLALAPAAKRALRTLAHAGAVSRAVTPAGWATTRAASESVAIALPVRRARAGIKRTGTQLAERLRGGRGDDRLSGRGSGDRLLGAAGDDQLVGGGGNDRAGGGTGHDDLSGNFGNDRLDGGTGDDTLRGASGDDTLRGAGDADRLDGGTGNDTLDGGPGDDILDGFDGDDTLRGGTGDDYLVESRFGDDKLLDGGPGADYVDGNRGNDRLVRGGEGDDIVLGGPGSDTVDGGPGNDVVDGGAGEDPAIRGGSGNDTLVGGRGNDTLEAGPGDDVLYGSTGADHFDCGSGEDWIHVDSDSEAERAEDCEHVVEGDPTRDGVYDPVALVANRGLARGGMLATKRGSALGDVPRADRPIGTAGDDEMTGNDGRDLMNGNEGNDLMNGLGGNDDLDGGDDDDELRGGDGRDRLFGRFGDDDIHGENGNDELEGGRGSDTLDGGSGDDKLNGGFDEDVLRGGPGNDRLVAVGGGVDEVDCGPGRDRADVDRGDVVRNCEDVRRH